MSNGDQGMFGALGFALVVLVVLVVWAGLSNDSRVEDLRAACAEPERDVGVVVSSQKWEVVASGELKDWLISHRSVRIDTLTGMGDGLKGSDTSYFVAYSEGPTKQKRDVIAHGDMRGWIAQNVGRIRLSAVASLGEGLEGSSVGYLVIYEGQ